MGKIVVVSSGKGGTGKTTSVAAVASCLAALEHKTLCIDFDAGLKNLDLALCMSDYAVADFQDVVNTRLDLMEACHESPHIPNLFFLAAPTSFEVDEANPIDVKPMFSEVRREFDYCIIDAPAGIGNGFKLAHADADMSIIVTNGELPAIRDAQRVATVVREAGVTDLRLLINRVLPNNYKRTKTTLDDVIDTVGVQLIGVVREDENVFLALHMNIPLVLYKKRRAAYDFLDATRRLVGEDVPLRLRRR